MKYVLLNDVLNFSWDQLAAVFWHRYPNPRSTHVIAVDTFHRELRRDGTLFSKRLIKKLSSVKLPSWGQAIAPKYVYVIEESIVDPKGKTITTYNRNISSTSSLKVVEKGVFTRGIDNRNLDVQRQVFMTSGTPVVGSAIESISFSRYKSKTAPASIAGYIHVLTERFRPWELHEDHHKTAKELFIESKEKFKESTEKFKESKAKSKEKLKESKEYIKETAQNAKEKSKETILESREKMKGKAQQAAKMAKDRYPKLREPHE